MIVALVLILGAQLLPMFVATWRSSLFGLSAQGLLMGCVALATDHPPTHVSGALTLADLMIVRGLWAPWMLYGVLRRSKIPDRNDVIPPNLLWWTIALGSVLVSARFSARLAPVWSDEHLLTCVVSTGVTLGFLTLSTQPSPITQMIGVMNIENAIALFELGGGMGHAPVLVQCGQIAVLVATLVLYRWYLRHFTQPDLVAHGESSGEAAR